MQFYFAPFATNPGTESFINLCKEDKALLPEALHHVNKFLNLSVVERQQTLDELSTFQRTLVTSFFERAVTRLITSSPFACDHKARVSCTLEEDEYSAWELPDISDYEAECFGKKFKLIENRCERITPLALHYNQRFLDSLSALSSIQSIMGNWILDVPTKKMLADHLWVTFHSDLDKLGAALDASGATGEFLLFGPFQMFRKAKARIQQEVSEAEFAGTLVNRVKAMSALFNTDRQFWELHMSGKSYDWSFHALAKSGYGEGLPEPHKPQRKYREVGLTQLGRYNHEFTLGRLQSFLAVCGSLEKEGFSKESLEEGTEIALKWMKEISRNLSTQAREAYADTLLHLIDKFSSARNEMKEVIRSDEYRDAFVSAIENSPESQLEWYAKNIFNTASLLAGFWDRNRSLLARLNSRVEKIAKSYVTQLTGELNVGSLNGGIGP